TARSFEATQSENENISSGHEAIWNTSLNDLSAKLDPQIFAAYIKPLRFSSFDQMRGEYTVAAPSNLVCKHVEEHFQDTIKQSLRKEMGGETVKVRYVVEQLSHSKSRETSEEVRKPYVVVKRVKQSAQSSIPSTDETGFDNFLNPRYTFANYVVGNSNQFCHAAAMRVGEEPGKSYNPLFIYGGVGLGKTHLLHAIGNSALEHNPRARVLYMSSETFTNELITSLRLAKMDSFKNRLRNIDVLLIDDIQFMCGKERTQEEFFHTFNALYSAKNQIVITSDKIPQEIPGIEERLRTRFAWGLTADLQAPDFETRVAILKRKASLENFTLPEDVAHFIAENISSNVRELEGALTRLHAVSSLQKLEITRDLAESALSQVLKPKVVNVTIKDIKAAVSQHFDIKVSDMVSKRRTRNLSFPRHIAMYLCRKHTTASYPEIGSQFGGRDHSSVIHAANVISNKIEMDSEVRETISRIEKDLLNVY
ncbi:MAG: chromosomal replication initiator protein DnaA, partial [Bdellovibrionales bacterium]|nr:chromosomal replication initiator protein DnaA [Bdellovibrionales bacterium]